MKRLLTIWIVLASTFCCAQGGTDVRVLILDYKSGRPVKGQPVGLDSTAFGHWLVAKTDKSGIATFQLTDPLPKVLTIDPEVVLSNWSCSQQHQFQTSEVLERGIVAGFEDHPLCKDHTPALSLVQPGDIIVYTRHLNAWLTFRRFMHETING